MTDESNAKGDRETELLKWQHDAGLPHPPTSFTIDYRKAIDDAEGPRAYDWVDKPHRLVFDLCRYIEEREVRHRIASTHAQPDSALARVVDTAIQKVMDSHPLAEPVKLNLHEAAAIRAALLGGAGDGLVSEDAVSHALLLHNRGLVNVPDDTEQGFTTYYRPREAMDGVLTYFSQSKLHRASAPTDSLTAERDRLREALKPFAKHLDEMRFDIDNHGNERHDDETVGWIYLTHGDFRRARAALKESGHG